MLIRNVLVLGGSGFLGRHVAHQLVERGMQVRVPTRNRERAKELILLPTVDVVKADVQDTATLDHLVAEADAVVNLIGILHGDFQRIHVELPRKIIEACRRHRRATPGARQRAPGRSRAAQRATCAPKAKPSSWSWPPRATTSRPRSCGLR